VVSLLETGLRELRYGLSLAFGHRIDVGGLQALIEDILATQHELGPLDPAQANLLRGGGISPESRRVMNDRRLRAMATMAYEGTAYYRRLFDRLGVGPDDVSLETVDDLPITPKHDLRAIPDAFVNRLSTPNFRAFTTGTTGPPTSVWFSRYEIELAVALGTIAALINGSYGPEDVLQINISSRATLALLLTIESCRLLGTACSPVGMIDPEESLSRLAAPVHLPGKKPQVSIMTTYPSYLGALVQAGEDLGFCAADFGLEQILCGGEILTDALRGRAEELFGARVVDGYLMTEIFPMGGLMCTENHIHLTPEQGLGEVVDLDTNRPVSPGQVGTLVATPFFPFREATLVFRFRTGDVVRLLDGAALTCELAGLPALSQVLGKTAFSVSTSTGRLFARDFQELLEAEPSVVLPCRFAIEGVEGNLKLHALVRRRDSVLESALLTQANEQGIPVIRVCFHEDLEDMPEPFPIRADLREATLTRYEREMGLARTR
jgi:phenylacetate-CoA ligase